MDRAKDWLSGTAARWSDKEKTWHFPSGATLSFGYLEHEDNKYRYQSSEFQFVGFDELTQFSETQYRYLFSRLRRLKSSRVPVRMRAASNPGGIGHEWVRQRFLTEKSTGDRVFVPARLDDNPHLDRQQYVASLSQLDPITKAQLLAGDWMRGRAARSSGASGSRWPTWRRAAFASCAPGILPPPRRSPAAIPTGRPGRWSAATRRTAGSGSSTCAGRGPRRRASSGWC
jgi:hypothetical protein